MQHCGVPPDAVLLTAELVTREESSVVETVSQLFHIGAMPAHLEFYIRAVWERSQARRMAIKLVGSTGAIGE